MMVIRRIVPVLVAVVTMTACGDSPTLPSGGFALTVRTVDEITGQGLIDPLFGIVVHVSGPTTADQAVVNGMATFSGLPSGAYTVTAGVEYAYAVLDVIPVMLAQSKSIEFRLRPKDDLIVTELFV